MSTDVVAQIVRQNLGVYRAAPSRLKEDVSQEAQVASDYRGRLVYELLQNADDAMADGDTTRKAVAFLVTPDALWMANTGRSLSDDDVQGLCGLGASSKVDATGTKRASIGHKGLGFKSVLEITDAPAIYSHSHSFRLGATEAQPHIQELWSELGRDMPSTVPAMRFPTAIQDPTADEQWQRLREQGFNTAFRFPFRSDLDDEQRESLARRLLSLPLTTVLFLKHLKAVSIEINLPDRSERRDWTVLREIEDFDRRRPVDSLDRSGLYRVTVSGSDSDHVAFYVAHDANVQIGANRTGLSGPAWDDVNLTEVSVASPANNPRDGLPEDWKHFHVFLPTEEYCPYPLLINGAFATDLSRQHLSVRDDPHDYNAHLLGEAARVFAETMLPRLLSEGVDRVLEALDRGEDPAGGEAAGHFHERLVKVLAGLPLLPIDDVRMAALADCVLPTPLLGAEGEGFREVLMAEAMWEGAHFPVPQYCRGRWARVASDHGAAQLTTTETLQALGRLADPLGSALTEHDSGGYEVDPVLELSSVLWERADKDERAELEAAARLENVFPVHRNPDGTVVRVALGDDSAFYPPQSATRDFPLRGIRFMTHAVCWGALNKNERSSMLGDELRVWTALFGISEFRFQEVMQAAVLPALGLNPSDEELEWRESIQNVESLAAICQLAGAFTKPDRPLRFQRLQSDRAIFNLSRLPVPCVRPDGTREWIPAYRVYFGRSWLEDRSLEEVLDAIPGDNPTRAQIEAHFLAPPETFLGMLDQPDDDRADDSDDDEVALDEDVDRALETSEFERWLNFLSWIGVNRSLRLIHFHDVEDRDTGWLTTQYLRQPQGWAFANLGETWDIYRSGVDTHLAKRPDHGNVNPYFYELHDLDHGLALVEACEHDPSGRVASSLFEHLALHWAAYAPYTDAQLALVDDTRNPRARTKPQRAQPDEITEVGENFWLFRLRTSGICPTSRGPRRPDVTWRRSLELERRFTFSRGKRTADDLVPVVLTSRELPAAAFNSLCDRVGVRRDISPSTYTLEDAHLLCEQLKSLYSKHSSDLGVQRYVIRPAYRSMFELLSGHSKPDGTAVLAETPLLAETAGGYEFLPAKTVLYAATPGIKQRSGMSGQVPIFVLDAEPAAEAPLTSIFGCRTLEKVLDWRPHPGECPLDDAELTQMRDGLGSLLAPLLARLRRERTRPGDRRDLEAFVAEVEPVDALDLVCVLDDKELSQQNDRTYFVRPRTSDEPFQAFVVWDGPAWPPTSDVAQSLAMALADALGTNLVETFLAFITSSDAQRRQLLDIAGASAQYQEVLDELSDGVDVTTGPGPEVSAEPTPAPEAEQTRGENPAARPEAPAPAAPPVPLHSFESLLLDGEPILLKGDVPSDPTDRRGKQHHGKPGSEGTIKRAAPGTDLSALDALGMNIAIAYEVRRLEKAGRSVAVIAGTGMTGTGDTLVVDTHTPAAIAEAAELSAVVLQVMEDLEQQGISRLYPGFDLLSIKDGNVDRMIELKSSGVDARVQAMSWNEWKSASRSTLRPNFWLYLAGNLRADLGNALPYLRAIHDPFGSLIGEHIEETRVTRAVQLRVREFAEADQLNLTVTSSDL